MGTIKFVDAVDLKPLGLTDEVKDFYASNPGQMVKPLRIKIAATHSGKITRNNGFYLPHKMKDGAGTFTKQYQKPIQVHHEEKVDPIGRAISASYVDTSGRIRDSFNAKKWKDSARSMNRILDGFVKGTLSRAEIVDVANEYFIQDARVAEDPDYEGLGYVELTALITDPAAIQKLIDGRYLTGSVGASTNQAVCSACKQDWAEDGPCDHKPGRVYDDTKCVLIAGDLNYEEYSFVNKPADRHSKVIEVNINGVQDFVRMDEVNVAPIKEYIPEISLIVDNASRSEEEQMETAETTTVEAQPAVEEIRDEMQQIKDLFGDTYTEIVDGDTWGQEYVKMLYCLVEDATPETKEAVIQELKDKVLKAADRKALGEKTFCGPDRSYPVPDCSHARAAVAYAKKYDAASSIVSCAKRKAARLGCPIESKPEDAVQDATKEKKPVKKAGKFDVEYFDRFTDRQIQKMKMGLDAALLERGVACEDCKTEDSTRVAELEKLLEDSNKNKGLDLMDMENLNRALADAAAEIRSAHISQISNYRALSGDKTGLEAVSAELKDKTGPEIRDMLKGLTMKVDINKIADTLNSGLSNRPVEVVEDPTKVLDGTEVPAEAIKAEIQVADEQNFKAIKLQWLMLRTKRGQEVADKYVEDCKTRGLIPADWSIKG